MLNDYLQKGQKGDQVNVLVKVEFGEKSLGESPKENCTPNTEAELNYSTNLNVIFDDPHSLDEISTKPLLCESVQSSFFMFCSAMSLQET